jgi:hypothetical protein
MGQDLELTGGALNIRTASELCSKGLWKLLAVSKEDEDRGSRDGAIRIIAINPTLREECGRILPQLQARHAPAGPEGLMKVLVENAPAFGIAAKSAKEWGALFQSYLAALEPLSVEALEDAFLRWNRGEMYPKEPGRHAFYPRAAELFHLAQKSRLELGTAIWRARKALEHVDRLPKPEPTPEERAARRQALIDEGILDANGKVVLGVKTVLGQTAAVTRSPFSGETPQQMAQRLYDAAQRHAANTDDEEAV